MVLPSVSAVVPTLHRPELLKRCVQGLLRDSSLTEVLICIDGPDESSRRIVEVLAESDRRVTRVQPSRHEGRMQARQNGVEASSGDVILLIDDDVVPTSQLARAHALRHEGNESCVVMGSMAVAAATNVYERIYAREYNTTFEKVIDAGNVLQHLWGGNVSLRRSDALRVGLVSPGFEDCYFEDRDFGLRCADAGLRGVIAPEASADHHHTRDAKRFVDEAAAMGRGTALLHRRHPKALGVLQADHFVRSSPKPIRPIIRSIALAPDCWCVAALEACPSSEIAARLIRRAKQHKGSKN